MNEKKKKNNASLASYSFSARLPGKKKNSVRAAMPNRVESEPGESYRQKVQVLVPP